MRLRNTLITATSLVLAISLTGCGAGPDAASRGISRVTDGAETAITTDGSNIKVRNLLLVELNDGSGTGVLVGSIINSADQEDALLGISVNGINALYSGESIMAKNSVIQFEGASANAKAVIPAMNVSAGKETVVSLFFAKAGLVEINAIVRDQRDTYAGITA
jgi:copper(I)-binding protein